MPIVLSRKDRLVRRAILTSTLPTDAVLDRRRLDSLDLRRTSLAGRSCVFTDFTGSDLSGADLRHADCRGACFTGTHLVNADLRGANLREATLMMADLSGALIAEANLTGVIYDQSTIWPAGFKPSRGDVGMWHGRKS